MTTLITTLAVTAVAAFTACTPGCARAQTPASTQHSPTLTWNQITREAVERVKPTQHQAARLLAYVSMAQYAALVQGRDSAATPDTVATASMRVIADLAPTQGAFAEERFAQLGMRKTDQGHTLATSVLAQAHSDEFGRKPDAQPVQGAYMWKSLANPPAPPAYPALGAMRPFVMDAGNMFRVAPPPSMSSIKFANDMAEILHYTVAPTRESTRVAKFYDMTTGTMAAGYWNEQAEGMIRKNNVAELQAARILATMNAAIVDALIACHDSKYVYWVPRPSQAEPTVKPLIGVPNHPSYPSNHSCLSTAAGMVLAHFFPSERSRLEKAANEAGLSRIYAGIHYRFDIDAGEEIGRKVAALAAARHEDMLARWTQTTVAQRADR
jgi:PAP2 superfamily